MSDYENEEEEVPDGWMEIDGYTIKDDCQSGDFCDDTTCNHGAIPFCCHCEMEHPDFSGREDTKLNLKPFIVVGLF